MSRKINAVTSNLQALLRQDSEVTDKVHVPSHLTKKVEVAINVLPTTPLLRGIALEVVLNGFLHVFEQKEIEEESPLYLALTSSCDLISSLLSRSPSGWCDTIFTWGINLIVRLSSTSSAHFESANEKMEYWMSKPLIKRVVEFISIGVEYRVTDGSDVINCVLDAVQVHKTETGWLLAHIIAIQPSLLMKKLFEYDSTLSSIVIATVGRSLDLLVEGYPLLVQESLLGMVQRIVDTSNSRGNIASLKLLTQLTVQSPPILQLVAEEALITPQYIYNLMTSAVESGLTDGNHDNDEGEVVSGDEGEEMEHDGPQEVPLLSSLSSLLLQLSGSNAVSALDLIVGCIELCGEERGMEEEEDGEINPHAIAKGHLLKATRTIMTDIILVLDKAVNSVLLSSPSPSSEPEPLKLAVSLEQGLTRWASLLAETDEESLLQFLTQLIGCVGVCGSEIVAAKVLSLFLRKSTNKLSTFVSLHERYLLCHSRISTSVINESVAELGKDNSDIDRWCYNVYRLTTNDNESRSDLEKALCSNLVPIFSLLSLTTPTSAVTLMSSALPLVDEFVARQPLADSLNIVKCLLDRFFSLLISVAQTVTVKGVAVHDNYEYQLCLCRSLVSSFAKCSGTIKNFGLMESIAHVTSMDMTENLVKSNSTADDSIGQSVKPFNLLLFNSHSKLPIVHGSLLNTRQTQHSGSLHKKLTLDTQQNNNTNHSIHSLQSMAITHSNDHILCLLSDVIGSSTERLGLLVMDTVAPSLVITMGTWPEIDFSGSARQMIEIHLNIKRCLDQSPILWKVLLLVSTDPRGFIKCSSLVQSLLDTMISVWSRRRASPAVTHVTDLTASELLIQSVTQAGWIPRPLCYVGELFSHLKSEEVANLHQLVYLYIKDNYRSILSGCQVPNELDSKTRASLKSIMIRNIEKLGHVYHRFVTT